MLAALCLPALLVGVPAAALAPAVALLLGAAGIGSASAALGAAGPTPIARAVLGAGAWAWLLAGSIALGFGSDLGIAPPAPDGWVSDPAWPRMRSSPRCWSLESLLGAGVFALAAAVLGWVLAARHASIALLGAMVWAAAVDAGLSAVGNGALGGRPLGVVGAAVAAVGIEFLVLRGREPVWHRPRRANGSQPLTT